MVGGSRVSRPPGGWAALLLAAALFWGSAGSWAATEPPAEEQKAEPPGDLQVYDEIEVEGRASDLLGIADSAGEGVTGRQDLEKRPISRPGRAPGDRAGGDHHPAQRQRQGEPVLPARLQPRPRHRLPRHRRSRPRQPGHARPWPGLQRPQLPDSRAGRERPLQEGGVLRRRGGLLGRRRRRSAPCHGVARGHPAGHGREWRLPPVPGGRLGRDRRRASPGSRRRAGERRPLGPPGRLPQAQRPPAL